MKLLSCPKTKTHMIYNPCSTHHVLFINTVVDLWPTEETNIETLFAMLTNEEKSGTLVHIVVLSIKDAYCPSETEAI